METLLLKPATRNFFGGSFRVYEFPGSGIRLQAACPSSFCRHPFMARALPAWQPDFRLSGRRGKLIRLSEGREESDTLQKIAPDAWKIKMGEGSVEYPDDPENLLKRMDLGKCITGFWGYLKYRSMVKPNP
jgi:hypothetical protein